MDIQLCDFWSLKGSRVEIAVGAVGTMPIVLDLDVLEDLASHLLATDESFAVDSLGLKRKEKLSALA